MNGTDKRTTSFDLLRQHGHSCADEMFAALYAIAFVVLLGCAFMQMRQGWSVRPERSAMKAVARDRTGLRTIHPELLDSNGQLIKDDLLTVSFENHSDGPLTSPGAQPGY